MSDRPNSLGQLIGVRFKEYLREPEALFWSFGFPILLAVGLGIAFRSKPPDLVHVAVVAGPHSAPVVEALRRDKLFVVEELVADSASVALRTGRVALLGLTGDSNRVQYEFDHTCPGAPPARPK